jgi:ribosome biogenesis GTPase
MPRSSRGRLARAAPAAVDSSASERANGLVVGATRRQFSVALDDDDTVACLLKGRSAQIACGDRVTVTRLASGGVIEAVSPRQSLFYRSDAWKEKLIAANVTQVVGVTAPDVAVDENLLNRWIIAAEAERCRFVLVANKADLPGFPALMARLAPYRALGYPVVETCAKRNVDALRPHLAGAHSVLIGQSGMGKSTLINALFPSEVARTGTVSSSLGSGRHTTAATTLYRLAGGVGWIVDSPGMKVFGLAHFPADVIAHAFVELRDLIEQCRFRDCRHEHEPGCAVQAAIAEGRVAEQRVALLQALLREREQARTAAY